MAHYTLGREPSPPDPRDWPIRSLLNVAAIVPVLPEKHLDRVLSKSLKDRFDQGNTNSCVGQSTGLIKRVQERRDLHRDLKIDPVAIWMESKLNDGIGRPEDNRGTFIRTALDRLLLSAPVTAGWSPRLRIASYFRIQTLDEAKAAIFAVGPIVVGSTWFEEWFDPEPDGMLPKGRKDVGGHAFVLYGWDNEREAFRAANSWGTGWGDHGDFWIPFDVWGDALDEAWKAVDAIDVPKDPA
jgi:hypothetical protein